MTWARRLGIVLSLALIGGLLVTVGDSGTRGYAQDGATPTVETAPIFEQLVEEPMAAPSFVRLLRITLQPSAAVPAHTHPGPEMSLVERGTLSVMSEGPAMVTSGESGDTEEVPEGRGVEVSAGDIIFYPAETEFGFRNDGAEPVDLLTVVMLPAGEDSPEGIVYAEGTPAADAFAGVSHQVLGDGAATTLPDGPFVITLSELLLNAGDSLPAFNGPTMISLIAGEFKFSVTSGRVQPSRTSSPGPQSEVAAGTELRLSPGDAAFFPLGVAESPRAGAGQALLHVLTIRAADEDAASTPVPESELAVIAIEQSETLLPSPTTEATTEADATPAEEIDEAEATTTSVPTGYEEGAVVEVGFLDVRLRTEPSTGAEIVADVEIGTQFTIMGEPVEADGYVWYPVTSVDDPSLSGWIAGDFLDPVSE